eukprot:scpid86370/ scgid28685/ 
MLRLAIFASLLVSALCFPAPHHHHRHRKNKSGMPEAMASLSRFTCRHYETLFECLNRFHTSVSAMETQFPNTIGDHLDVDMPQQLPNEEEDGPLFGVESPIIGSEDGSGSGSGSGDEQLQVAEETSDPIGMYPEEEQQDTRTQRPERTTAPAPTTRRPAPTPSAGSGRNRPGRPHHGHNSNGRKPGRRG